VCVCVCVLQGAASYEAIIDEWSLGCVILELVVGLNPLEGTQKPGEDMCMCDKVSHINYNSRHKFSKVFKYL
jgi:serine/threonine protein kinase